MRGRRLLILQYIITFALFATGSGFICVSCAVLTKSLRRWVCAKTIPVLHTIAIFATIRPFCPFCKVPVMTFQMHKKARFIKFPNKVFSWKREHKGNTDFESGNLCISSSNTPHLNTFRQFEKRSKEERRAIHIGYQRTAVFFGCTFHLEILLYNSKIIQRHFGVTVRRGNTTVVQLQPWSKLLGN